MDIHRQDMNRTSPSTGWRRGVEVASALLPLWWVPALAVVLVVLAIKAFG